MKVCELPTNPILQIRPLKTQINNFFDLSVNPGSEIYNLVDWVVTLKGFQWADLRIYKKIYKTEILNFKRVGGFASMGKFVRDYGIFSFKVMNLMTIRFY